MRLARSTIVAPLPGDGPAGNAPGDKVLLVQPLTGQAALLSGEEARRVREAEGRDTLPAGLPVEALRAAGFVVESADEEHRLVGLAWEEYQRELARTPTQLIVVPSFGCNLKCTYCYQEPFDPTGGGLITEETIDALFRYLDRFHLHDDPRPYLTLFGGEPLRDTPTQRQRVERILAAATERGLQVAVVTNGYDLAAYLPLLRAARVKEVQVTLDGPPELHDLRRPHASGQGTFARVDAGIRQLVAAGLPVNLRIVADRENLPLLPALAQHAADSGWLDLPEARFKTQVGRNYELFGCASRQKQADLYDRLALWQDYTALAEQHPVLARFHKPRLHGMRHLAETGELPVADFDACPATKREWAFAPDGGLYGCTATVGNPRYRLGRYAPVIERDEAAIAAWSGRNVLSIPKCRDCASATVCGGGCGAVAAHQALGNVRSPDCRPVKELLALGARYYHLDA